MMSKENVCINLNEPTKKLKVFSNDIMDELVKLNKCVWNAVINTFNI